MNALRVFSAALVVASLLTFGCSKQQSKQTETKTIDTPAGSTTVTTEKKVDTKGDHPPAANP